MVQRQQELQFNRKQISFHSNKVKLGPYYWICSVYFRIRIIFRTIFFTKSERLKPEREENKNKDGCRWRSREDRQRSGKGATPSQQCFLSTNKIIKRLRVCFPLFSSVSLNSALQNAAEETADVTV